MLQKYVPEQSQTRVNEMRTLVLNTHLCMAAVAIFLIGGCTYVHICVDTRIKKGKRVGLVCLCVCVAEGPPPPPPDDMRRERGAPSSRHGVGAKARELPRSRIVRAILIYSSFTHLPTSTYSPLYLCAVHKYLFAKMFHRTINMPRIL